MKTKLFFGTLLVAAALATPALAAEDLTWTGTIDGTWDTTTANWSGESTTFAEGDNVTFDGSDEQKSITLGGDIEAGNITFTEGGYTISNGTGTSLTAGTILVEGTDGTTVTIATSTITATAINFANHNNTGGSGDDTDDDYKKLIIGDGENVTTATAESMSLLGQSEISVAANSTLTVGSVSDAGGYHVSIAGAGTLIAETVTIGGNASNEVSISVADFQAGEVKLNNGGEVTISSASFKADYVEFDTAVKVTFTADCTAVIGTILNDNSGAHTIEIDGSLTTGSFNRQNGQLTLEVNGTLTVDKSVAEGADGYLSFAANQERNFGSNQTLTGTGTVNVYGLQYYASSSNPSLTISVANLNIGEGGIVAGTYGSLHFAGTTIGLYNTDSLTLDVDMTIDSAGVTFNTNSGESLTLSGVVTGDGLVTKTGEGSLTLSGTNTFTGGVTISGGTVVAQNASALGSGDVSVANGATLQLETATTVTGTVAFSEGATLILSDALLASAAEQESVALIMASSITYKGESLTDVLGDFLEDCIDFDDDKFDVTFSYSGGTLTAEVTYAPEPSMFGLFFGLGAVGLVATRRRRRA